MTKLEGDDRPTYVLDYPRWARWSRTGAILLLMGAALVRWILAWVRFLQPVVQAATASSDPGRILVDMLAAQPLRPLISAHLSLALAAGAIAFVYHVFPPLSLTDDGLAIRTLTGWQVVPWRSVRRVRIVSFDKPGRRLVLVQGSWSRWSPWPRLVSACLGAGFDPGLVFGSAIRDFKPLMLRLYREVSEAAPEAAFDDKFASPSALLVMEPMATLVTLVEDARDEGWPMVISAQVMGAVTAGLVIMQVLFLILQGDFWWKSLAVVALCGLEWLIGALYLLALAEFFPALVEFHEAALLYPLPQLPRAVLAVPMAMLIAAGVPFLAAMLGLVGVLWAVILTALLVQQLYHLKSILSALIGVPFQALFQFIVLAIVFS